MNTRPIPLPRDGKRKLRILAVDDHLLLRDGITALIGDEDDMRCIHTGVSNLEVNGPHFEDELILQDASGKTIGALGVVFNYKAGDDKAALEKIAEQTRNEMKAKLPSSQKLFAPA